MSSISLRMSSPATLAEPAVGVKSPVRILWGENDPWEPIDMGRAYADKTLYPCVDEFVPLPGAGHCPMDQTPEKVNEEILRFLKDYKF